jgi:hypothetical protein
VATTSLWFRRGGLRYTPAGIFYTVKRGYGAGESWLFGNSAVTAGGHNFKCRR